MSPCLHRRRAHGRGSGAPGPCGAPAPAAPHVGRRRIFGRPAGAVAGLSVPSERDSRPRRRLRTGAAGVSSPLSALCLVLSSPERATWRTLTGPEDGHKAAGGRGDVLDPEAFCFLRAHCRRWGMRAEGAAWGELAEGIVRGDGKPREVRGAGERRTAIQITGMNVHSETQSRLEVRKAKTPPVSGSVFAPRFDRGRPPPARAPTPTLRRRMSKKKTQAALRPTAPPYPPQHPCVTRSTAQSTSV